MKPFMIATALAMLAVPAHAEIDKTCFNAAKRDFGLTAAKRVCDSKYSVKPNELGWSCERGREPVCIKDTPGGPRLKRDASSE